MSYTVLHCLTLSYIVIYWQRSTNRGGAMSYAGSQVSAVHRPNIICISFHISICISSHISICISSHISICISPFVFVYFWKPALRETAGKDNHNNQHHCHHTQNYQNYDPHHHHQNYPHHQKDHPADIPEEGWLGRPDTGGKLRAASTPTPQRVIFEGVIFGV